MGSDREVAVRNGFSPFFPLVTWLSCFKHVEDDIERKLNSLAIKDPLQREFLDDIFGNEEGKRGDLWMQIAMQTSTCNWNPCTQSGMSAKKWP